MRAVVNLVNCTPGVANLYPLFLFLCSFYSNRIGDEGCRHLAETLESNSSLTALEYGMNRRTASKFTIQSVEGSFCIVISPQICKGDIRKLLLAWPRIERGKVIWGYSFHLFLCRLRANRIGEEGYKYLARALKSNITLNFVR